MAQTSGLKFLAHIFTIIGSGYLIIATAVGAATASGSTALKEPNVQKSIISQFNNISRTDGVCYYIDTTQQSEVRFTPAPAMGAFASGALWALSVGQFEIKENGKTIVPRRSSETLGTLPVIGSAPCDVLNPSAGMSFEQTQEFISGITNDFMNKVVANPTYKNFAGREVHLRISLAPKQAL